MTEEVSPPKVLVVCARRYNGHELWTALGVMQSHGIRFDVASTEYFIEDEVTGQPNRITLTLDDVEPDKVKEYDGLMFVSGNMQDTEKYWKLPRTLAYVDVARQNNLAIAAICCSVPTIREAASGKRVSFFPLVRSRELLVQAGAIPQTVSITVDGRLVTAEHQMSSQMWAEHFSRVLMGEEVETGLVESGFVPKSKARRRLPPEIVAMRKKSQRGT